MPHPLIHTEPFAEDAPLGLEEACAFVAFLPHDPDTCAFGPTRAKARAALLALLRKTMH